MTIWNPLKNFGGAPLNAREWPSSRATQEAKLRGAASRLLKKGRLPLTLNCESDSYANKGMAGGIDARFGCADG